MKSFPSPGVRRALLLGSALAVALPGSGLRAAPVILNEYNAVAAGETLEDDHFDAAFGPAPVKGNGGPWFELLVCGSNPTSNRVADTTVDLRGWHLDWSCKAPKAGGDEDAAPTPDPDGGKVRSPRTGGTLTLTEDPFWQNLRAGTLLTFTRLDRAHGGADTDTRFSPALNQWHVNVWTGDARLVAGGGADLLVTSGAWQLVIRDRAGGPVFGPAGEGVARKHFVDKDQVCILKEVEPRNATGRTAHYDGGGTSTFGLPNVWSEGAFGQDLTLLRGWAQPGVAISWPEWRDYWFKDKEILTGQADPDADPDGDGLTNLVEAALGLNPRLNDAQFAPVAQVVPAGKANGGGYYLTLTVDKPATQVQGIAYRVETSPDGTAWSDQGTVVLVDDVRTLQVRDNVKVKANATAPTRFIRLNVLTE